MNKEFIKVELAAKELAERNTNTESKMNGKECSEYRSTHENCHGCQYEPACSKMVGILLATFDKNPARKVSEILSRDYDDKIDFDFYDPTDFNDDDLDKYEF